MSKPRIYCDANIYLDLFESRKDHFRDLGEFAYQLLKRTLDCEFDLIVSDWLLYELGKYVSEEKMTEFFSDYKQKNKIINIKYTGDDMKVAKHISPHFQDALHQLLAKRGGAKYLVTRNVKDFDYDKELQIVFPENI